MIDEVRTDTLRPGTVAAFEERYATRLAWREQHSKLGAFWHTKVGPLNQVIHVYPTTTCNTAPPSAPHWPKTPRANSSRAVRT